ncbi:MAG: gliding motility-associated C-terminal domain-containing protein, partial [Bacteroidales bacterium]|nr:gliding motility-associated C-terminal domain-containing protein [Bacteroidales bacterium]
NIVEVVAPAGFAAYQWYINPSNNPDLAAVAITANEIPAIHSGTNDTLFVTQESNIMQGQPLQHVFVKLTSVSTTVGIPACIGYQSIDITDVKPRADFTVKNNGTLDIQFTNTSDTLTNARKPDYYKWEFDDGSPDVEWHAGDDLALWSPMHTYASCGTKHVILTASKGICSHVVEKDIFIPCLNVMDDTLICVGTEYRSIAACSNEIDLTNPAFIWTNPAEDTLSTTNSYTHSYQESDTLIVTISAYNESTSSTLSMRDTVIVSVQQFPEIQLEGDTILCLGETANIRAIDLSGSVTGMKWVYTRPTEPYNMSGATTSPILPTFQPTKDTTVYLLAQTSQGCIVWDSITIHVVKPEIHASKLKVCPGQPVVLWGTNAQSYTWTAEPDDPAIPTTYIDTITVYPNVTTTYTMAGYGSSGCHADKSVTIEVIPYPTAIINYSPEYVDVSSPAVSFTDVSPYSTSSRWDFSDGSTSNARSLTYRFSDVSTDTVWIRLTTYNELGCSDDTTIHLPVLIFSVWVPTAFSPDGDGLNDRLFIYTLNVLYDLSFEVYNRWGTIVYSYSTKELRPEAIANMQNVLGWDGTVNGSQAGQGTYVYRLQYKMQGSSRVYDKTGTVNLVK